MKDSWIGAGIVTVTPLVASAVFDDNFRVQLSHYRVETEIERGGMGVVCRAVDTSRRPARARRATCR